jgi:hypothetical protein
MKTSTKIVLGVAAIAATALIVSMIKKEKQGRMLSRVSDEGYETAPDLLFPNKSKINSKVHYGPVLPS